MPYWRHTLKLSLLYLKLFILIISFNFCLTGGFWLGTAAARTREILNMLLFYTASINSWAVRTLFPLVTYFRMADLMCAALLSHIDFPPWGSAKSRRLTWIPVLLFISAIADMLICPWKHPALSDHMNASVICGFFFLINIKESSKMALEILASWDALSKRWMIVSNTIAVSTSLSTAVAL